MAPSPARKKKTMTAIHPPVVGWVRRTRAARAADMWIEGLRFWAGFQAAYTMPQAPMRCHCGGTARHHICAAAMSKDDPRSLDVSPVYADRPFRAGERLANGVWTTPAEHGSA